MNESFNRLTFDLLEATVALYAQDADGGAGALLVADLRVENLRMVERWIEVQTRPTGATFPRNHPLVPEYLVTMGRLSAFDLSDLTGFQTTNQRYVVDVLWTDQENGEGWHRATFYGVTIAERSLDARDVEAAIGDAFEFKAEQMVPGGGTGAPPEISGSAPLTVRYVSASEDSLLYVFDTVNGWQAQEPTAGRAVIALDGSNNFSITFDGHAAASVKLSASDNVLRAIDLEAGNTPRAGELPRLDFYAGTVRVGSVTERGKFFCANLSAVASPETEAGFILGNLSSPPAILDANGLQVIALEEFFPTDPLIGPASALLAWHRMESLAGLSLGDAVKMWPDDTINLHSLAATGCPRVVLQCGVRCVQVNAGEYFHCYDTFDTSALQLFCVARRAVGTANVALPGFGTTGDGSLRWKAGKQSAVWQHGGAIPVAGTLGDGNLWSIFELEKAATGTSLRLSSVLDGMASHAAFGSPQDYFFMGDATSSFTGGWVQQGLVYGRQLTASEADDVRMWLRSNLNLP